MSEVSLASCVQCLMNRGLSPSTDKPAPIHELTPWFDEYRDEFMRMLSFGEHETCDHPVASECLSVDSGCKMFASTISCVKLTPTFATARTVDLMDCRMTD